MPPVVRGDDARLKTSSTKIRPETVVGRRTQTQGKAEI
jgi:hypothetical protein